MWLFAVLMMIFVGADRWLKLLAQQGITKSIGFSQFTLVKNDALVFSWPAPNWFAALMMIVVIGGLSYALRRKLRAPVSLVHVGYALIVAGALSNLYDRLVFGYVIDWAYLGRWWPVINIADVMIGVGVIVLLVKRNKVFGNKE